jgi:hypothetical protein
MRHSEPDGSIGVLALSEFSGVRYTRGGAQRYLVSSQCATDKGHYDLSGTVARVSDNRYSGWVGRGRQTGRVELVQHGDRLALTVTSRQGSAKLTLARS